MTTTYVTLFKGDHVERPANQEPDGTFDLASFISEVEFDLEQTSALCEWLIKHPHLGYVLNEDGERDTLFLATSAEVEQAEAEIGDVSYMLSSSADKRRVAVFTQEEMDWMREGLDVADDNPDWDFGSTLERLDAICGPRLTVVQS